MRSTASLALVGIIGVVLSAADSDAAVAPGVSASQKLPPKTVASLQAPKPGIWKDAVGAGFQSSARHVGVTAGAGPGMTVFGTKHAHDIALGGVSYGKMWGDVKGEGHWWRGNWEWHAELFAGSEFNPRTEYLVGLAPHIRYNFATGTRWVPFLDAGGGVTATDIGKPELGGAFQFNLQPGLGVNYFVKPNLALSAECRWLHLSSARISTPNLGVNTCLFIVGLNWFF
ncbi:MAG: acyloxyacyl hydrolase [Verrucomicrobia bacterium]|nr:acyloxyacyl hydrolase [Verrucomicrobiota bacterium]